PSPEPLPHQPLPHQPLPRRNLPKSDVASRRARIAARRANDLTKVPICIDRDQAQQIADLEQRLAALTELRQTTLTAQKDSEKGDIRLSGDRPVAKVDTDIKTVEDELAAAWDAAADVTFRIVLRALPPDGDEPGIVTWQGLLDKHADGWVDDSPPTAWCRDIAEACFVRAETVDGDDLGMSWAQMLAEGLDHGEWERVWRTAMIHNRVVPPSLDFSKRRSVSRRRAAR
ncbi:MAG: hypothetical protein AAGC63_00335, partial [Propionicimonas sp.]